jgi:transposase-like protein
MTPDATNCNPSTPQPKRPMRKLDAAAKELVFQQVAAGHTIAEVAEKLGISDRTIYREQRRDPLFKLRLRNEKAAFTTARISIGDVLAAYFASHRVGRDTR